MSLHSAKSIRNLRHALLIFLSLLSLNTLAGVQTTYIHNDALGTRGTEVTRRRGWPMLGRGTTPRRLVGLWVWILRVSVKTIFTVLIVMRMQIIIRISLWIRMGKRLYKQ